MSLVSGLLNQTVTSISSVSSDGYGDVTETVVYSGTPCRWQESIEQEAQVGGELIRYNIEMWLLPEITIKEKYRVIKDLKTYVVVKAIKRYDLDGNHDHTKVYLE